MGYVMIFSFCTAAENADIWKILVQLAVLLLCLLSQSMATRPHGCIMALKPLRIYHIDHLSSSAQATLLSNSMFALDKFKPLVLLSDSHTDIACPLKSCQHSKQAASLAVFWLITLRIAGVERCDTLPTRLSHAFTLYSLRFSSRQVSRFLV